MRFTLITQVVLLTLSVAIIFLFIKPALAEIKIIQDDLLVYSDAVAKASEYNDQLQKLITDRDSFSQADLEKLEQFVPTTIDTIAIMHEIENIFASSAIKITSLIAKASTAPVAEIYVEGEIAPQDSQAQTASQDFEIKFNGDYDALKTMLGILEANARLLEVISVSYGTASGESEGGEGVKDDSSLQSFTLVLRAYALSADGLEKTNQ